MRTATRILMALAALAFGDALAQAVHQVEMRGQLLQHMDGALVKGCGIRVMAARPTGPSQAALLDASVSYYGEGEVLILLGSFEAEANRPLEARHRRSVTGGWFKAPGSPATTPTRQPGKGDDAMSLAYMTNIEAGLPILRAVLEGSPIQVGLQRADSGATHIYAGRVALDGDSRKQLQDCLAEVLQGVGATATERK